jgi:hypothetical protein
MPGTRDQEQERVGRGRTAADVVILLTVLGIAAFSALFL